MKFTKFRDIPRFTDSGSYRIDVDWDTLEVVVGNYLDRYKLDMNPDFQRGHVWTEAQQICYIEFRLRGGISGCDILFNAPNWQGGGKVGQMVLVDGKQRLQAVRRFMDNEIPVFGSFLNEFTDRPRFQHARFSFHVNDLPTRAEVLQWYVDLNAGGIAHTNEEIDRVRKLLAVEANGLTDERFESHTPPEP